MALSGRPLRRAGAQPSHRELSLALFGREVSDHEMQEMIIGFVRSQLEADMDPALRNAIHSLSTGPDERPDHSQRPAAWVAAAPEAAGPQAGPRFCTICQRVHD